jgi:hypothetical protein
VVEVSHQVVENIFYAEFSCLRRGDRLILLNVNVFILKDYNQERTFGVSQTREEGVTVP